MLGKIKQYIDELGNKIFPITKEKCIYDDHNMRLDNKLNDLPKQFYSLQSDIEIPENSDLNNPAYHSLGNYYCKTSVIATTILNLPSDAPKHAFTLKIFYGTGISYHVQEIKFFRNGETYRRNYDPYTNVYGEWIKYLSTTDLINNDTTGGANKVLSAEVGKVLGQEIDVLYNQISRKTGMITFNSGFLGEGYVILKINNICHVSPRFYSNNPLVIDQSYTIGTIEQGFRPKIDYRIPCYSVAGAFLGLLMISPTGVITYLAKSTERFFAYGSSIPYEAQQ